AVAGDLETLNDRSEALGKAVDAHLRRCSPALPEDGEPVARDDFVKPGQRCRREALSAGETARGRRRDRQVAAAPDIVERMPDEDGRGEDLLPGCELGDARPTHRGARLELDVGETRL